jgi:RNA 2',3'-cyclic 3'-phosphodiesterase
MRVFLAVIPPPETQAAVAAVISSLRAPGDGVSWVREKNLHFTLRFLGEVTEATANRAALAAGEAAVARTRFTIVLGRAGAFPDDQRARVLWLGPTRGEDALVALAEALEQRLVAHGFPRSEREFSPHLTLGRRRQPGPAATSKLQKPALETRTALSFEVRELTVIESVLSPGGSQYSVRFRADLASL